MSNREEEEVILLAPENFAMVENGIYRSAFPRSKNIEFLRKLKLKSIISLVPEDYPLVMCEFYDKNNIQLFRHGLDGNKWPFKEIDHHSLYNTLVDILNPNNQPLLIHCNKGKHRTGSVCGSIRKIRGWALSAIFTEYLLYAYPKTRIEDQQLIESFEFKDNNNNNNTNTSSTSTDNNDNITIISLKEKNEIEINQNNNE